MAGSMKSNDGKKTALYRANTANASLSATQYLVESKFKVGISTSSFLLTDTDIDIAVPISNGTVCDNGSNNMTGSSGGDNSTDNITVYKQGAGETDNQSQNLIANGTNVNKIWTLASLTANAVATKPFGLWFYVLDATTLAKFKSSGIALEIRIGSDTSNYYSYTRTAAQITTGWNWITSNTVLVSALTATGTPGTPLDTFQIIVTTNNATDTFVAGDVLYDLFRQWATTDLTKAITTGYPSLDMINLEATRRYTLTTLEANGYLVDSIGEFNADTTNLMLGQDFFDGESKSDTDEIIFNIVDRQL